LGSSGENHSCRFEEIANSILQGNGIETLESWQNRLLQNAKSSTSLNALGILHGRLVSPDLARRRQPRRQTQIGHLHMKAAVHRDLEPVVTACKLLVDPLALRSADLEALKGRECFGGLDLGSVRDLTSLVLAFPDDNVGLP